MRRRVPEQPLRGSDITSLEIQTQDLLRKPVGQIAPVNVCDLFALASVPNLGGSFSTALGEFTDRITQEIADIPDGPSWEEFVDELRTIPGDRVPASFRALIGAECGRDDRNRSAMADVIGAWHDTTPADFLIADSQPKIQKSVSVAAEPKRAKGSKRAAPKRVVKAVNPERVALIKRLALERVNGRLENGLKEAVLVAGIRHRARTEYPDLLPSEIISVLKGMKESGQLHYSAGRWKRVGGW